MGCDEIDELLEVESQGLHDDESASSSVPASNAQTENIEDDDDETAEHFPINSDDHNKSTTAPHKHPNYDNSSGSTCSSFSSTPSDSYRQHTHQILSLTIPIILSEIFQNTLPVIDIAFVGNLPGKDDLAAAALATVWFNLWNATLLGFMTAIDTMLAQSFGAGELGSYGMWTGNSLVVVCGGVVPLMAVLVALCEPCMLLFGQDAGLAESAGHFSYRLLPGLWPYYAFKILTKYLQSQNRIMPGVVIGFMANGFNIVANWLFIYRFDMGLNGAPWATSLTRLVECIAIMLYILYERSELRDTYPTFSRNNLRFKTIRPFLALALSGATAFACEAWSFEITTILAGLLGTISLDAHIVTLTIATFVYLSFPFAVGIATSIRVGQLIGDGRPADARRSTLVSYGINTVLQLALTAVLYPLSHALSELFVSDEDVSALVAKLVPISCIFMMGDAFQANTAGALRGLGRQNAILLLNVVGFWVLAVPVGSGLTFGWREEIGVAGFWWGFVVGLYLTGAIGIVLLVSFVDWDVEAKRARLRVTTSGVSSRGDSPPLDSSPLVSVGS